MPKKFTGEYIYVSHNRNKGLSKKDQTPYDFATLTLSDGLESIKHTLDPDVVQLGTFNGIKRGDTVEVTLECSEGFNRVDYIITDVKPAKVKHTV